MPKSYFLNSINIFKTMKKISFLIAKVTIMSFFMMMVAPLFISSLDAKADTTSSYSVSGVTVVGDANQNALVGTMCNALKIVTGNFGKAVAAFAII